MRGGLVHLWVLAVRLRVGLRVRSSCAIGLRVIIIVDVDIVIINYLNNFARGALTELPYLQLAEAQRLQLFLKLNVRILLVASPILSSWVACLPPKHLGVPLRGRVLLLQRAHRGCLGLRPQLSCSVETWLLLPRRRTVSALHRALIVQVLARLR